MSDSDSFIDEVSEEVRREKLYGYLRRYGWIAVVAVVALVGGAAWNEYSKSRDAATAQSNGAALNAALASDDVAARAAALQQASVSDDAQILQVMLAADALYEAGEVEAAVTTLAPFTSDAELAPIYRDMAILKSAMLGAPISTPEERISQLAGIAAPGAPYRLLAEEQIALAQAELGEVDVAIEGLRAIASDAGASPRAVQRATQFIIALGGNPTATTQ